MSNRLAQTDFPPIEDKPTSQMSLVVVIGIALFVCVCVLPICAIVILAILGPAIGNIFSEINASLVLLPGLL